MQWWEFFSAILCVRSVQSCSADNNLTQWAQVHLLNVFKHWLPTLSKPYYLIIFVDPFLHYLNVVDGQFVQCKKGPQILAKNNVYTRLALNIYQCLRPPAYTSTAVDIYVQND